MSDSLGWRHKMAILIPSTNTSVQPEFDAMRPPGVTNHICRIRIPNIPLHTDEDFNRLIQLIADAQDEAVDSVMSCEPDRLVLGISAETFWDGLQTWLKKPVIAINTAIYWHALRHSGIPDAVSGFGRLLERH